MFRAIDTVLIPGLKSNVGASGTFTLIQFSGVHQLEGSYVPGKNGDAGYDGIKHYNIEQAPAPICDIKSFEGKIESLDGNGQIYLALQDMNLESFRNQFAAD